jgi:prolyl-tRNA editing enzyme YbaK/EbsC (Cys-tRNA(Pro) deacylase)
VFERFEQYTWLRTSRQLPVHRLATGETAETDEADGTGSRALATAVTAGNLRGMSADASPATPHPSIANVTRLLHDLGATGSVRLLPESARTAQQAADGLRCEVGAIANSLVFDADGSPVLILTSGAHRVDTTLVAATIGVSHLRRADPDFVRTHTGQVIGGVAPIGHPVPVPTYLDRALAAYATIWAAAGHSHAVFDTSYDELLRLTSATEIDVAPSAGG